MSTGPIESKVKAASLGAAAAGVIVWALETYMFKGAVPVPIQAFIDLALPALAAFAAGYAAKHTFRRDPDAVNSGEPPPPV